MTTGQRIKAARKRANMTQAELAQKLDIPPQSVSQWERDVRKPKIETLRKIAKELNCLITDLFTADEVPFISIGYNTGRQIGYKAGQKAGSDEQLEYLKRVLYYSFSDAEQEIVYTLSLLNDEGQQKAVERIEELAEIPKYRKTPQE